MWVFKVAKFTEIGPLIVVDLVETRMLCFWASAISPYMASRRTKHALFCFEAQVWDECLEGLEILKCRLVVGENDL